jgi:hypothetical protein
MTEPIKLPTLSLSELGAINNQPLSVLQSYATRAVEQATAELREQIRCLENDAAGEAVVFDTIVAQRDEARAEAERLREAAKQALDAIVWEAGSEYAIQSVQTRAALKALRAALKETK